MFVVYVTATSTPFITSPLLGIIKTSSELDTTKNSVTTDIPYTRSASVIASSKSEFTNSTDERVITTSKSSSSRYTATASAERSTTTSALSSSGSATFTTKRSATGRIRSSSIISPAPITPGAVPSIKKISTHHDTSVKHKSTPSNKKATSSSKKSTIFELSTSASKEALITAKDGGTSEAATSSASLGRYLLFMFFVCRPTMYVVLFVWVFVCRGVCLFSYR